MKTKREGRLYRQGNILATGNNGHDRAGSRTCASPDQSAWRASGNGADRCADSRSATHQDPIAFSMTPTDARRGSRHHAVIYAIETK